MASKNNLSAFSGFDFTHIFSLVIRSWEEKRVQTPISCFASDKFLRYYLFKNLSKFQYITDGRLSAMEMNNPIPPPKVLILSTFSNNLER